MSATTAARRSGSSVATVSAAGEHAPVPQATPQLSILRIKRKRTQQPTPLDALGSYSAQARFSLGEARTERLTRPIGIQSSNSSSRLRRGEGENRLHRLREMLNQTLQHEVSTQGAVRAAQATRTSLISCCVPPGRYLSLCRDGAARLVLDSGQDEESTRTCAIRARVPSPVFSRGTDALGHVFWRVYRTAFNPFSLILRRVSPALALQLP